MKTIKILGMNLAELSMRDICEEITDLKKDLAVIEDYEQGIISFGELTRETMFAPEAKNNIIVAINKLKQEKLKRNNQ
jgi:hypothetical protein